MTNKEKEALFEIFESEKSFVNELKIWAVKLNRALKYEPSLNNKKVTYLCNLFFTDPLKILDVHTHLLKKMKDLFTKSKDEFDEKDIYKLTTQILILFEELLTKIRVYSDYMQILPKIDFYFRHEYKNSKEFNDFIDKFFQRNNIDKLGYNHFIYKPFFKLLRYPLLLEAVKKRIKQEELLDKYIKLLDEFNFKNKEIERIYKISKSEFRLFELSKIFKDRMNTKSLPNLFLSNKKRTIFDERDIYVKLGPDKNINKYRVIVLDNFVLFCDVVMNKDDEILYIVYFIEQFKFLYKKIENHSKEFILKIFDLNEEENIELFFRDNTNLEIWLTNFLFSIRNVLKYFDTRIEIRECKNLPVNSVTNVILPLKVLKNERINLEFANEISCPENFDEKINIKNFATPKDKKEKIEKIVNYENLIQITSKKDYIKNFFIKTKLIDYVVYVKRLPVSEDDKNINLIINNEGIFLSIRDEFRLLSRIIPENLIYIKEQNIVFFLLNNNCYASPLNSNSIILEAILVRENISTYFYTCIYDSPSIFLINAGINESKVYFFDIQPTNDSLKIQLQGKYFIPATIYSLEHYSNSEIILCSNKFFSLNIENTITRELTTDDDIFTNCYFNLIEESEGKKAILVGDDNLLICYKNFGYLLNKDLKIFEPYFLYTWDESAYEFKIYKRYLIVLGVDCVYVYDLKSTLLLFYNCSKSYKFVHGDRKLKLHDDKKIYELILPD